MFSVDFFKNLNINSVGFRACNKGETSYITQTRPDAVTISNEAAAYNSPLLIEYLVNNNPELKTLLQNNGLSLNTKALKMLESSHLPTTKKAAIGIARFLPHRQDIDYKVLAEAATLHDIGKIFIPDSILNKKGSLTPQEQQIMHLHPVIGYELLKNTKTPKKVLDVIKYHHQNLLNSGYPDNNGIAPDINTQIIHVADKFSALCEKRAYKNAMSKSQALEVIAQDVREQKISAEVFNALVMYANS